MLHFNNDRPGTIFIKMFYENNSPKLARNDFVQRDIPINYSMPSPLNSPSPPFLASHCSLRPLPTLLTKGFLFSYYLVRFVGRTNDILGREERALLFFFLFFVPSRAVTLLPTTLPFFSRSFPLLQLAFFLLCIRLLQFRRRQSERISHNDVDCSRQLTIEASASD